MSLTKKLLEVARSIRPVLKASPGGFFSKGYISESDLVERIRPIMLEKGILVLPQLKDYKKEGELVTAVLEIKLLDVETNEAMSFTWAGQGVDKGDEGLYKAYTGALKHFFLKTFLIPTRSEEDLLEERDQPEETKQIVREEPATSSQKQYVKKLLNILAAKTKKRPEELELQFTPGGIDKLTKSQASRLIDELSMKILSGNGARR